MILFRFDITERDISPSDSPRHIVFSKHIFSVIMGILFLCSTPRLYSRDIYSEEPFAHRGLPPSTVVLYSAKFCRVLARSFSRTKHVLY